MRTPKKGDEVKIVFRDHVKNGDAPAMYIAYGRVAKVTPEAITIDGWAHPDPENPDRRHGDAIETYTLLRAVIDEVYVADWTEL